MRGTEGSSRPWLTGSSVTTQGTISWWPVSDRAALVVSRTVVDLVAGSGIAFTDRGEHELRGVPGSWRLYAVEG